MLSLDLWVLLQCVLFVLGCRLFCIGIYRLYICPLSRFPGPKIAALTSWYEFYYDIVKDGGGLYIWEVQKMHQKHGPIVRVNPYELHVSDPTFFGEIYARANRPRNKFDWHSQGSTSQLSFAFTTEHSLHRLRREPLHSYFSKGSIVSLEPMIRDKVEHLCARLSEFHSTQEVVNLSEAFVALTVDIISQCCYADSFDYLAHQDFAPAWRETVIRRMRSMKLVSHFPILLKVLRYFPSSWTAALFGDVAMAGKHKTRIRDQVQKLLDNNTSSNDKVHQTIFKELLESNTLPTEEKGLERLTDEGAVLLGAGSETVAKTLGIIFAHLAIQPDIAATLRQDLEGLMPAPDTPVSWVQLEQLPLLTAVIKEGLRLHHGLTARNPRVAPYEDLHFKQWTIPAGTPVSSIQALIHLNNDIFPNAREFVPSRWLHQGKVRHDMDSLMLSFGRGTRACLGINLAWAELYIATAMLVRRFDFTLYKTDVSDVDLERDFTIPTPRKDSVGVRALVKKVVLE